jgi:hypothetical protein
MPKRGELFIAEPTLCEVVQGPDQSGASGRACLAKGHERDGGQLARNHSKARKNIG